MNRAADSRPIFTAKQGQYLAFIHAYTLVIGDMAAGQWVDPFSRDPSTARSVAITRRSAPSGDFRPAFLPLAPPVGLRPPYAASGRTLSHPDCRPFSP